MSVGGLPEREDRPALVRFKKEAVEDKAATLKEGHYVAKDVDYALITPPYSKDVVVQKVTTWLEQMEVNVRNGRFPQQWLEDYRKQYQAWQNGQELPPNGTPIRGWPVISPAQMEMLLHINILTVEDLAGINDQGARSIGMGSLDLKNKARAWLAQRSDKGPLTVEIASVKAENAVLKSSNETMQAQLAALTRRLDAMATQAPAAPIALAPQPAIGVDDILPDGDSDSDSPE